VEKMENNSPDMDGVCAAGSLVWFAVAFHCLSKVFLSSALTAESDFSIFKMTLQE